MSMNPLIRASLGFKDDNPFVHIINILFPFENVEFISLKHRLFQNIDTFRLRDT